MEVLQVGAWRELFNPWIVERWREELEQIILDHSDYRGRLV